MSSPYGRTNRSIRSNSGMGTIVACIEIEAFIAIAAFGVEGSVREVITVPWLHPVVVPHRLLLRVG
jgi:hypothetical protein